MHHHPTPTCAQSTATGLAKRLLCQAAIVSTLALGACAGGSAPFEISSLGEKAAPQAAASQPATPQTELQKATAYWGKEHEKNPKDPQAAINYIRNLKALGAKQQALGVAQNAYGTNPTHKAIASEYGRLALDQDQLSLAEKLLAQADDAVAPDWKIISARGTVLAKQGKYRDAIPQFERALALAPGQPAILNNLALAHAMNGQAEKAEPMLRQAASDQSADPKVTQNLSLVLGLQGKHDDAKSVVMRSMPADEAAEDATYVKQMVGVTPNQQWSTPATKTASISTSSTSKTKAAPAPAKVWRGTPLNDAHVAKEDPAVLVQRLADGNAATSADAPVQLVPKR